MYNNRYSLAVKIKLKIIGKRSALTVLTAILMLIFYVHIREMTLIFG